MTSSPSSAAPSGGLLRRLDAMSPRTLLWLSIWTAVATIGFKMAAWWVSGSVSLLSDAMESFVNLASAAFALRMVIVAHWPADAEHPYGHHKAEYFSSGFEGMLIIVAAAAIGWASVHRLMAPQPLERVGLGALLSVVSSALNGLLAWRLMRGARVHRSIALEADARHLMTDVWTTAGVLAGIGAVLATGWLWLDPVIALLVALNILHEGGKLVWRSAQGLMDEAVEPEVQALIHEALHDTLRRQPERVRNDVLVDHLTTRRAAQRRFADLHLHLPTDWTLGTAARLRGELEYALMRAVPGLRVTIQLLPHDMEALFDDPPPPPPPAGAAASGPPVPPAPPAPSATSTPGSAPVKALLQRVREARVEIAGETVGAIGPGLLVLVCAEQGDGTAEADRLLAKILRLRIFSDAAGKMNRSLQDLDGRGTPGGLLLVSQFTLAADTRSGNRPSFTGAAPAQEGRRLYDHLLAEAGRMHAPGPVRAGRFGADMQVHLVNDGPVTIPLQVVPPAA